MNSQKKHLNYVYNKQMLSKIQSISNGERSNEMEIKNYAEELDTLEDDLNIKRKNIQKLKEVVIKNNLYSNKNIPSNWKYQPNNEKFVFKAIKNDLGFTNFITSVDLEKEEKLNTEPKLKLTFNSIKTGKEEERQRNIARCFKDHKKIKRQIADIMCKSNDGINNINSVLSENFIDSGRMEVSKETVSKKKLTSKRLSFKKSTVNLQTLKDFQLNTLNAINTRIKKKKEDDRYEQIKQRIKMNKETIYENQEENNKFDILPIITTNGNQTSKELGMLLSKLNDNLVNISKLGMKSSLMIKENEMLIKSVQDRARVIKHSVIKHNKDFPLYSDNEVNVTSPDNYSYFLNSKDMKFKGKFKIIDSKIKNKIYELSEYKHFGPYASYCNHCNLKNVNFFNNLEIDKGIDILDYLLKHN